MSTADTYNYITNYVFNCCRICSVIICVARGVWLTSALPLCPHLLFHLYGDTFERVSKSPKETKGFFDSCLTPKSRGSKRDNLHGTNGAEFAVLFYLFFFLQIFVFSWELQHFGGADFRRKPQETADFCRKPQETADSRRNPFVPFTFSLVMPLYKNPGK